MHSRRQLQLLCLILSYLGVGVFAEHLGSLSQPPRAPHLRISDGKTEEEGTNRALFIPFLFAASSTLGSIYPPTPILVHHFHPPTRLPVCAFVTDSTKKQSHLVKVCIIYTSDFVSVAKWAANGKRAPSPNRLTFRCLNTQTSEASQTLSIVTKLFCRRLAQL